MALRKPIVLLMTLALIFAALAMDAATSSAAVSKRVDLKVLLLGTSTTEPDFASWQAALQREGVPFEAIVTSPGHAAITPATLSDTLGNGTQEAKYQGVIVSVGGLPECTESGCVSTLAPAEWTALEEYEQQFSVRQITGDVFPSSAYGLNSPTSSGALDGTAGALTAEGKPIFPYLNGLVGMDNLSYGYEATPLTSQAPGASFQTLLSGPGESALVGVYTHANGDQELVETFNQNQYQLQAELLRHGALNWLTRGVYFGDQRNYYEADIDDNFLSDDSWSTATHENDYNAEDALRETPADVEYAAGWSAQNNFRIDMLFNGGGSAQYQEEHGSDPTLTAFQKDKNSFGWISHTWDHPNIDIGCASQSYIEAELNENNSWGASTLGLSENTSPTAAVGNDNPSVIITGEHSGLANLIPGNPGVVDPPDLDSAEAASSGGKLAPGSYVYALTDDFVAGGGESIASESAPVTVTSSTGSVELEWDAVCHAAQFKVYRELAGSNQWTLISTIAAPSTEPPNSWFASPLVNAAVTGGGALPQKFTDTGTAGALVSGLPSSNGAVETAYPQNPKLTPAFKAVGVQYFGSDASKPYPNPAIPGSTAAAYPAGTTFTDGTSQAIPRYPTNIYYNASTEAQEVDEFNTLYTPVADGGKCVNTSTTTCRTAPANFAQVVSDVDTGMFQHVMGNDPRPHYFHQTNIMGSPPPGPATIGTPPATSPSTGDGLFYSVLNPLLEEYEAFFNTPIEQPTMAQIGQLLAEQSAWSAAVSTNQVSGYIEGNQISLQNTGTAINIPLTGVTGVGSVYGGIQSGWTSLAATGGIYTAPAPWPGTTAPAPTEAPKVTGNPASAVVTAGEGATFNAAASGLPAATVQWQVSTNAGVTFANDTTDAGNTSGTLTVASTTTALSGREYRAVFTNTAGSATSTVATLTVNPKPEAPKVTSNPASKTVTAGESATFTAAASGVPAATVQWQVSTNAGVTFANDTTDAGNTSGTLTVASTTTALSGREYRAVFTNATGSATSTAATLTVNAKTEAPNVTSSPASKTVTVGESATFTAAASGVPAATVRWQVSTNAGVTFANDTSDSGNATGTLTVANTTTTLSGREYRAVFTNSLGSATTSAATLTVKAPLPIVSSLSSKSGAQLTFVTITGKNFTNVQAVYFGSQSASGFVLSSTEILAEVPSGSGTVDVTVKTAGGTSATSSADRFTYSRGR
jgi:hypothetical protein